jgi:hypothetical protein
LGGIVTTVAVTIGDVAQVGGDGAFITLFVVSFSWTRTAATISSLPLPVTDAFAVVVVTVVVAVVITSC